MKAAQMPNLVSDPVQDHAWNPDEGDKAALPPWLATLVDLASDPDSSDHPPTGKSALLDKAYEDYCARREAGERLDPDAYCEQFPHLQSSLTRLIRAHRWLEDNPHLLGEAPPVRWPEPGQSFLGFELQRELGRGAFARVFLATEQALGHRRVAVKLSRGGGAEASTLGRINHPNIVSVYSVQEDAASGLTAVCMPYHGSATLCDLLDAVKANPTLPRSAQTIPGALTDGEQPGVAAGSYVDAVCAIGAQLAEALQFIHDRNICHRDLKPSNVLMTPDGRPMLLDFNLCDDPQVVDTRVGGTLPYMPPEQLLATGRDQMADTAGLDARSDLYSLGVMLYELLTGQHPFGPLPLHLTPPEARRLLLKRQPSGPKPVRRLNPEVDPKLARLVEGCLAYNPLARPQRAAELAAALRRRQSPLQRARRWVSKHRWLTATAAILIVGITAAALAFWPEPEPEAARLWRLAGQAYQAGRYAEAVDHYNKLDILEPGRVYVARARAYQKWGETNSAMYSQAAADLLRANAIQEDGRNFACSGYCMLRQRQTEAAAGPALLKATKLGFESPEHLNNLGYYWMLRSDPDKAIANLDKAISLNEQLQPAYHNRALAHLHWVQSKNGMPNPMKHPQPSKSAKENFPAMKLHLAMAKQDMGRALELAQGAVALELYFHAARIWTLSSDYDAEDLREALVYFETALKHGLTHDGIDDRGFDLIRNSPRFQELVMATDKYRATPAPAPPTRRILDPIHD
jgi:serine/threonine protein kinase/Flp pilus assembly protein TadD